MKSCFRILCVVFVGLVFSAFLFGGHISVSTGIGYNTAYAGGPTPPDEEQPPIDFDARTSAPSCNSIYGLGCCSNPECVCSGLCIPPPSSCPGCFVGTSCDFCTGTCDYVNEIHPELLRPFFDIELYENERWMVQDWFAGYLLPSMMAMAEELTTVAMHQTVIIGSYFDAKMELETHRLLQEIQAQAHKDYHPSEGVCVYATNVRGLAMSQRRIDLAHTILSNRAVNRHIGIENDNGAADTKSDLGREITSRITNTEYRSGRLRQFQDEYCNPREINEKLRFLCGNANAGGTDDLERVNNDIDFYGQFAGLKTLPLDFLKTEAEITTEEREYRDDFFALSKNLYGHKTPYRPAASDFNISSDFEVLERDYQDHPFTNYLDLRAMLAKRSVAENSFHAQTALRAQGDSAAGAYMGVLLDELGIGDLEIVEYMNGGISYYAQMEILTKKIYQNPHFYVNLYDKPANVKRKHVALKAIGLMQDWDTLEVELRSEMLASILLELSLIERQRAVENR